MTDDFELTTRLQTTARERMPTEPRPPRRRWPFGVAAGLVVAVVIGVAVILTSGGTVSIAEPVAATTTPKPVACNPGQHNTTPEAYYDCVNGAWVPGEAPTPTTTTPPSTGAHGTADQPKHRATVPPTTVPPTTTPPPTTQPPAPQPEIVPDPPYRFRQTADGEPIRWRACLSMHWRYNPAGEPSPGAIDVVRAAVAEISAASGVQMIEDGVTSIDVSDPNQALTNLAEGEVVIGFASPGSPAIPLAGSDEDLPANVDPNAFVGSSARTQPSGADITTGTVALNREDAMKLPLDFSSNASSGALLLHEIGHVVGLQHVAPSTQIMGMWERLCTRTDISVPATSPDWRRSRTARARTESGPGERVRRDHHPPRLGSAGADFGFTGCSRLYVVSSHWYVLAGRAP